MKEEKVVLLNDTYKDVTNEILDKAIPNNNIIPEINKYKNFNEKNTTFDTKDIGYLERTTAQIIQNRIGGQFKLIHRRQGNKLKTPDVEYTNKLLFKNKRYFEIKCPRKSETKKSKYQKIQRQLNEARKQSSNVIISLLREECNLTSEETNIQIIKCLNNRRYKWINCLILLGKNNYIKIYQKKKRP